MKRFIIILVILGVVVGAGWLVLSRASQMRANAASTSLDTAQVTRGAIDLAVAATGSLVPNRQTTLALGTSGTVSEVLVSKGERVTAGQVLARLDTTDIELSIRQAEISLKNAEASLARASKGPSEEDLAAARAALAAAQANLADLTSGPSETDLRQAELAVDQAKNSLWAAQSNRDVINANPAAHPGTKSQAEAQVLNAEIQVELAQMNLEKLQGAVKWSTRQNAASQLAQAQASLARLESSPSPEDIAIAQGQVDQAKLNLEIARRRLDDAVLTAPFAGVLADWRLSVNDTVVPSSPAGVLVDDSAYYIDVSIDETEVGSLVAGQKVTILFDAFPTTPLTGSVGEIGVVGTPAQGIVYYNVRINLPQTDLPLRPSLTASVRIIVQHKEDVLLVMTRVLKRDQNGIYVMLDTENGPVRADVTVGISDGVNTEIISGVKEGDRVYINAPAANTAGGFRSFNPFAGQSGR